MEKQIFQRAAQLSNALVDVWYPPVNAAMTEFDISTPARQAAFIAQVAHESRGFTRLSESFDYAPERLDIFSQVPVLLRSKLGRQSDEKYVPNARQQLIANIAYANRNGNGDERSGDGWRYRARPLLGLTFRNNYSACGRALGVDLIARPELLETNDSLAARAAGWYWFMHECNEFADRGDFSGITRMINGLAMQGQEQRVEHWGIAKHALGLV